jgi:uncharacterized protein YqgV (UPF0045/DUF77 family)
MLIEAQFSLYPVKEQHLAPFIDKAVEIMRSLGLEVTVGPMSSLTYGESATIFRAFDRIIEEFGGTVRFVLITTISNACPVGVQETGGKQGGPRA